MFYVLIFTLVFALCRCYDVPDALVVPLYPRGFNISIPDEEGIKLVAYHIKINEEFSGLESGTTAVDITKTKNGRWLYHDTNTRLKAGDVMHYWIYVIYNDGNHELGWHKLDQSFKVSELPEAPAIVSVPTKLGETDKCEPTVTKVKGVSSCQGQLIFSDTFSTFNETKWTPERKFAAGPDYEFVLYDIDDAVMKVENDLLNLKPTLLENLYGEGIVTSTTGLDLEESCTGVSAKEECQKQADGWFILPSVASGKITTKDSFSFKYGKIDIRAKLPKGNWIYPELYLNALSDEYGSEYDSGQLTVAFLPGNADKSKELSGGCVLGFEPAARSYAMKKSRSVKKWNDDFHVYSLTWSPEKISVSVDDRNYGNIFPPEGGFASIADTIKVTASTAERWRGGSKIAPFDKEMYITLGVGVGGFCFPDRTDGTKPWENNEPKGPKDFYRAKSEWLQTWSDDSRLVVDYVKVWAL